MTPEERRNPDLLKASRKRRIAAGSGTKPEDINRLLKMHRTMADMMKAMGGASAGRWPASPTCSAWRSGRRHAEPGADGEARGEDAGRACPVPGGGLPPDFPGLARWSAGRTDFRAGFRVSAAPKLPGPLPPAFPGSGRRNDLAPSRTSAFPRSALTRAECDPCVRAAPLAIPIRCITMPSLPPRSRFGRLLASGPQTTAHLLALTASHFSKRGAMLGLGILGPLPPADLCRRDDHAGVARRIGEEIVRASMVKSSICAAASARKTAKPPWARKAASLVTEKSDAP